MKKNFIRTVVCTVVFCAVGVAAYFGMPKEQDNELLLANVEALAGGETKTTWTCVGTDKTCKVQCGMCGTKIKGKGTLSGSHSCSIN